MSDYDKDEYEYQELLAERRQQKRNSRYYDYRDPEAPDAEEEDDDEIPCEQSD